MRKWVDRLFPDQERAIMGQRLQEASSLPDQLRTQSIKRAGREEYEYFFGHASTAYLPYVPSAYLARTSLPGAHIFDDNLDSSLLPSSAHIPFHPLACRAFSAAKFPGHEKQLQSSTPTSRLRHFKQLSAGCLSTL